MNCRTWATHFWHQSKNLETQNAFYFSPFTIWNGFRNSESLSVREYSMSSPKKSCSTSMPVLPTYIDTRTAHFKFRARWILIAQFKFLARQSYARKIDMLFTTCNQWNTSPVTRINITIDKVSTLHQLQANVIKIYLRVIIKVPQVQSPCTVHGSKQSRVDWGPLHVIHIITIVFKRVQRARILKTKTNNLAPIMYLSLLETLRKCREKDS